jgi:two-component system, OmpR family, sensor histidine kinase KdpD
MANLIINKISKPKQYLLAAMLICMVAVTCYFLSPFIGYRVVGFILLITVSLLAVLFDIFPVLFAATLSALIWNFFFIPPHFTFRVTATEDTIMLLMYFVIAVVNAVLTFKIKQVEKTARDKEEREHTVKLYNTLLNSLSHELRTPIAAIIGATDNLQNNNSKLTPQNRNDLVTEVSKAAFRLNQQVENLLNMSRLESGYIQPKNDWCDINELVYYVVKRIEENDITQKVSININPDIPLFKLDKGMLEQVLYNLLNNATQYSPEHSTINVSAACHADLLQLIIEDSGIGFPENEIKNVFDKFYRLRNSRTGGTGLGLSIVKGFTEAMNGTVALDNISTGGARFTVEIIAETSYLKNLKNE